MTAGEWATTLGTLGLIGVTVWYAIQTQSMARTARASAESAREAAEYSMRSAAIAAAGTAVNFQMTPVYTGDPLRMRGLRIESSGAAVYLHHVVVEELWATERDFPIVDGISMVEVFPEGHIPALDDDDEAPDLLHMGEAVFVDFPREHQPITEVAEIAHVTLSIEYSFDGKPPLRTRRIEWETDEAGVEQGRGEAAT